jgi:hypothetical protein
MKTKTDMRMAEIINNITEYPYFMNRYLMMTWYKAYVLQKLHFTARNLPNTKRQGYHIILEPSGHDVLLTNKQHQSLFPKQVGIVYKK